MARGKISKIVQLALLVAILFLMILTPVGYLKIGIVEITFLVIPVAVGAISLGPWEGALLGAIFGISSFVQCFGASAFGVAMMEVSPVGAFVVCIFPRILIGITSGYLFKAFKKKNIGAHILSNLCAALTNTVFFVGSFILIFGNSSYVTGLMESMGTPNLFLFIAAFIGINGLVEAAVCTVVGSAVTMALQKAKRR